VPVPYAARDVLEAEARPEVVTRLNDGSAGRRAAVAADLAGADADADADAGAGADAVPVAGPVPGWDWANADVRPPSTARPINRPIRHEFPIGTASITDRPQKEERSSSLDAHAPRSQNGPRSSIIAAIGSNSQGDTGEIRLWRPAGS
jgi:hypothetical protein